MSKTKLMELIEEKRAKTYHKKVFYILTPKEFQAIMDEAYKEQPQLNKKLLIAFHNHIDEWLMDLDGEDFEIEIENWIKNNLNAPQPETGIEL